MQLLLPIGGNFVCPLSAAVAVKPCDENCNRQWRWLPGKCC
jgi:hypothetical protein